MPAYSQAYDSAHYDPAMPVAEISLLSDAAEPLIHSLIPDS
ncbi:MAG TPA: hypothetical protein PKJ56_08695 [Promineifilum sp.]|nr:hypothetical protein [Promineifilum sp.]